MRADDPAAIAAALARVAAGELAAPRPRRGRAAYTYPAPAERMAEAVEAAIASRSRR